MTKKEKLLEKLKHAKSMTWSDLNTALLQLGFVLVHHASGSSHCKFVFKEKNRIISLCRPHPGNAVKPYMLRQVRESLSEWGLL
ncbi:MAG: hypothetical protein A3J38_10310 [Gammaproteobacteria bacterium RIFCSPHIGHO2_12_FULL_45_9]|nr:MAG: hypothetical protein A3J38_10310 [Gammaproteobacteria bacterium RIFCSPHIGHO2_12_FULL_45_9]